MSPAKEELTIWTFRDASGATHLAIPLLELRIKGITYQLAVPEAGAPVVLGPDPEHADQLAVVVDEAIVQAAQEALLAAMAGRTAPALSFVAENPAGQRSEYQAAQMVAHAGQSYLVALDAAGLRQVFALKQNKNAKGDDASPLLVKDQALARQILQIAPAEQDLAGAVAAPLPEKATLTLADGSQRELQILDSVKLDEARFVIALDNSSDSESEQRAYTLRVGAHGQLDPVSDPALVERVRKVLSLQ